MSKSALNILDDRLTAKAAPKVATPDQDISFHAWLHQYARVKTGTGYLPYSVAGREPLLVAILVTDFVLGNDCSYASEEMRLDVLGTLEYGEQLSDALLEICGGAQFGKTILALLFKTYLGTVKFRSCMYALPDDDLVEGIIDLKERPEVIDQIPYVGTMLKMGKDLTASGKAVNRKGAMLYTDGKRTAVSMTRGLGKFPTSFSCDVVMVDERDDVKEQYADYLPGRMTSSDLRFQLSIGTQRYHGAGQNALFDEGTQHVGHLVCPACKRQIVPEEEWPQVARLSVTGRISPRDPKLDSSGKFVSPDGKTTVAYHPEFDYYFACPSCGAPFDRSAVRYIPRKPGKIAARHWSVRISQFACSALPVKMFVADWCTQAVKKASKRSAFNCDRRAIPESTGQKLTPAILERAMKVSPFALELSRGDAPHRFGGLDTGDLCYFTCRSRNGVIRQLKWAEVIADSDVRTKVPALFQTLALDCLFVDAGPLRDLARDLALDFNGLRSVDIRDFPDWQKKRIRFAGGVEWDGERGIWIGLRCAPVEFSGKPGSGIQQQARLTPDNKHIYPVISCNRDEAIQAAIDDLLTAQDGFAQVDEGTGALRTEPVFLLPSTGPGDVLERYRAHLLAGSCKVKADDGKEEHFVDAVPNHFLLSTVYARLAEEFAGVGRQAKPPAMPHAFRRTRHAMALLHRRNQGVLA